MSEKCRIRITITFIFVVFNNLKALENEAVVKNVNHTTEIKTHSALALLLLKKKKENSLTSKIRKEHDYIVSYDRQDVLNVFIQLFNIKIDF